MGAGGARRGGLMCGSGSTGRRSKHSVAEREKNLKSVVTLNDAVLRQSVPPPQHSRRPSPAQERDRHTRV